MSSRLKHGAAVAIGATMIVLGGFSLPGAEPEVDSIDFFERKVRPVLAANCFECHGDKKQKGELRLDSLDAILAGGEF